MECKYCVSNYPEDDPERYCEPMYSDSYTDVEIELVSKELELVYWNEMYTMYHESFFKINYCPMCGRKL